jgi:deoxyribodipyrimidine photolyase-related protein
MESVFLLFPHQLFKDVAPLKQGDVVYLIEEFLFFNQYKFHKQKLVFHRASMKSYESYLKSQGILVHYVQATDPLSDIRLFLEQIKTPHITYYDVCDQWLEKRIQSGCQTHKISVTQLPTPLFINTPQSLKPYFESKSTYFHHEFYIQQRKLLDILLDEDQKPRGGKWSYDAENRQKYPKHTPPPQVAFPSLTPFYQEAIQYVETHYPENYGCISKTCIYPTTHPQSEAWLEQFLHTRFSSFGAYEDAIVGEELLLHHSMLTPMLNVGLLVPMQVVNAALEYSNTHTVPLNSLEGFIRQIIGWREFIRGLYLFKGSEVRTPNFWKCDRKLPVHFYQATTGIPPLDVTIRKVLLTGYTHHIERLMILGNFMLLCEFHPDEVYQWFMELYIDAYDWVMVPNVYSMSQFADGGVMATKPYISGSSYVLKMSHFQKGPWCEIWDALFWRFMNKHRDFFLKNPRLGMLIRTYDKMSLEKRDGFQKKAEAFLKGLG